VLVGEPEKQAEFDAYVASRGYTLLTPPKYGDLLTAAGFVDVEAGTYACMRVCVFVCMHVCTHGGWLWAASYARRHVWLAAPRVLPAGAAGPAPAFHFALYEPDFC
jgi:hypothetical protein